MHSRYLIRAFLAAILISSVPVGANTKSRGASANSAANEPGETSVQGTQRSAAGQSSKFSQPSMSPGEPAGDEPERGPSRGVQKAGRGKIDQTALQKEHERSIRIPVLSLKYFRRAVPLPAEPPEDFAVATDHPVFRAPVFFTGRIRPIEESKKKVYADLELDGPVKEALVASEQEIEVGLRNIRYWVAVQPETARYFKESVNAYRIFEIELLYLGSSSDEARLFLFSRAQDYVGRIAPAPCFAHRLMGVSPASPAADTYARLEEQFGVPLRVYEDEESREKISMYAVDDASRTVLYIRDGGPEDRDTITYIQLSTYNNSDREVFDGLNFGDSYEKVVQFMGGESRVYSRDVEKGIKVVAQRGSYCSAELVDGKLNSILIQDHPYY